MEMRHYLSFNQTNPNYTLLVIIKRFYTVVKHVKYVLLKIKSIIARAAVVMLHYIIINFSI